MPLKTLPTGVALKFTKMNIIYTKLTPHFHFMDTFLIASNL